MKLLINWLADVYGRYGYTAVLIVIVVLVALVLLVAQLGGVSVGDIARWIGSL